MRKFRKIISNKGFILPGIMAGFLIFQPVFSSDIISGYKLSNAPEVLSGEWLTKMYPDSKLIFTVSQKDITVEIHFGNDFVIHRSLSMICRENNNTDCVLANKRLYKFLMRIKFEGLNKFTVAAYQTASVSNKNPGGVNPQNLELWVPDGAVFEKKEPAPYIRLGAISNQLAK